MSDQKMPPADKGRKNRSFGSFLLFLTVLIVLLFVFGKKSFQNQESLSHDQYYVKLWAGDVAAQKINGPNQIEGQLRDGTGFKVQFAEITEELSEKVRQIKAYGERRWIAPAKLEQAIADGYYEPEEIKRLTVTETVESPMLEDSLEEPTRVKPKQEELLYVAVQSKGLAQWDREHGRSEPPYPLPKTPGTLWLAVDTEELDSFVALIGGLEEAGATLLEHESYSVSDGLTFEESSSLFGTILIMWAPWILIIVIFLIFMRQVRGQGGAGGVMSFGRSRAQLYTKENHTNTTFDDVAGAEEAKEEVREVVEFLKNPGRFSRIGGRIPRGVLLVGPPGCGKTLLAKAIAGEAEVPFYSISGSDFVEMFVGVGASRVRDLFKQAREHSPCIIFLDEIDAVGRRRGSGMGGGHDEREQTLNAILVEMDGFGTDEGIIVLAATNRPDVLDPALLRPGRFDREVTIDLPDVAGRKAILEVHLKKVRASKEIDTSVIARSTPGYSGADLAASVNEAAIMAVLAKEDEVTMEHLEEARDKVRYGRKKISRNLEEADRRITAYHESGHAIVALELEEADDPHKITIVPRGRALGATMMLPEKESYHMQRKRLRAMLAVLFGGRASEEIFCGDISAGASDDIKRATDLARAMVTELGMSDKIGPINYADRQGSDFLGTELFAGKWHSERTAREIDEEVKILMDESYQLAIDVVRSKEQEIKEITDALLRYESLSGDELKSLLGGADLESLRPNPGGEPTRPADPGPASPEAQEQAGEDGLPGGLAGEAGLSPA